MFRYTLLRLRRTPVLALAVLVLAAVVSAVLCNLQHANEEERARYDEVYQTIPVTLTVTNLSGTQQDNLHAPWFVYGVFETDSQYEPNFSRYIRNLNIKISHYVSATSMSDSDNSYDLVGLSALSAYRGLSAENGVSITWLDGFDDSILMGDATFCVVPQEMYEKQQAKGEQLILYFRQSFFNLDNPEEPLVTELELPVKIAGYYVGGNGRNIYCSYKLVEQVYVRQGKTVEVDSVSATLCDNNLLEEIKQLRAAWFAEPKGTGTQTPWGQIVYAYYPNAPVDWNMKYYDYYPYALDIDDELLLHTAEVMENSIKTNQLVATVVLLLSAGIGFFLGFLIVRARKREIALLRTLGTANNQVFLSITLEQLGCVIAGTFLGGSIYGWQPVGQLALFVSVYMTALVLSLVVFMGRNLLTTIKEDE